MTQTGNVTGIGAGIFYLFHTLSLSIDATTPMTLFRTRRSAHVFFVFQSAVYSTVNKTNCDGAASEDDKEHDYSSIAEIKGLVMNSSSSDLYATVRDIYAQPDEPRQGDDPASDGTDPGYESIRVPKTSSSEDACGAATGAEGSGAARAEPDYESLAELGLSRETSRL